MNAALSWAAQNASTVLPPPSPAAIEHQRLLTGDPTDVGRTWNGLVLVHSQKAVEKVYVRQGFVTDESMGTWNEEGIDHVGMWKRIDLQPEHRRSSLGGLGGA